MAKIQLPSRAEVLALPDWPALKRAYRNLRFDSEPYEEVEAFSVREHKLNERLPNVEEFWRYHIAPATNRPVDTHFSDNVGWVTSRMAERSYEVYCNICDALDEMKIVKAGLKGPRYRACLNVLRFAGDALQLFDSLVDNIGVLSPDRSPAIRETLSSVLGLPPIVLFADWHYGSERWAKQRQSAVAYRNMLVHHGRPWWHFRKGDQTPYILKAEHCRDDVSKHEDQAEFHTWARQKKMFSYQNQQHKFIKLTDACEQTCDLASSWINKAYGRIVGELDKVLTRNRDAFIKYRAHWQITP